MSNPYIDLRKYQLPTTKVKVGLWEKANNQ